MAPRRKNTMRHLPTIEALENRHLLAMAVSDDMGGSAGVLTRFHHADARATEIAPIASNQAANVRACPVPSLSVATSRAEAMIATTLSLAGEVPGGMRGDRTTFTVVLRDAAGRPLSGQRIVFTESCGGRNRDLGAATTDAAGSATLAYKIPTDPNADNISLNAAFGGTTKYKASSFKVGHVEIGRRNLAVDVTCPASTVDEGNWATFTFSLSRAAKGPVTIAYATADRTALAGADYVAASGSITFAAGEDTKKVKVTTLNDAIADPGESLVMRIVSVVGATVGSPSSTSVTIRDITPLPPPPAPVPQTPGSWTVLVYMTGADLNDFARDDINEMEKALMSLPAGVRIAVAWDQPAASSGYKDHATGGGYQAAWGAYGRSVLTADPDMSVIHSTFDLSSGERNTGDPKTLVEFVKWGVEQAPAQHYLLQLWGHGGGVLGSQFDPESNDDGLTLGDIAAALGSPGMPRFDVFAYDNCLMAMAEVGAAIAPWVAGVFVASQEGIENKGQDYTTVYSSLCTSVPSAVTPSQVGEGMVNSFQQQYRGNVHRKDTLSAVATSGYATLNKAMAGFVSMATRSASQHRDTLLVAAKASPAYGVTEDFAYVDLAAFMTRVERASSLPQAVRSAASEVKAAVAAMVVAQTADQRGSGGIAVYMPTNRQDDLLSSYPSDAGAFTQATGWDAFARWLATGDKAASSSATMAAGRAISGMEHSCSAIPPAIWAAYAAELAGTANVEIPAAGRRFRG